MLRFATIAGVLATASTAHADSQELAANAAFTPGILRAHDGSDSALAMAVTSFNGASDRVQLDVFGEVRIWSRLRAVVQIQDAFRDSARPGVGAGWQFLDDAKHGIDTTAYLLFKTEGFSEPEGELELQLAFGKRLGPLRTTLDLAYGQDPEGNERDGEVALALHVEPVHGLFAGAVGRYRDALGSKGEAGVLRDGFGGATATLVIGHIAVTAQAGVGMIDTDMAATEVGPAATLAIGAAF